MSEKKPSKLIMIHLYIQTLINSYDPSGIQIIIPNTHSHTSNTSDTHSLSHTHIKTHTGLSLSGLSVCVYEMSIVLHVEDSVIQGNK